MKKNLGFYISILTTVLAVLTFGIAFFTPPLSGPFCIKDCYLYPYLDIASRFPRDYYWMYPAVLLNMAFYILVVCIHYFAPKEKKIYSHIGMSFALSSTLIFLIDYFIQVSVVQPSLLKEEFDGISLITQFNPHGIFIALEELGFILMGLTFLFLAFVFSRTKTEKIIRGIFITNFVLMIVSFVLISMSYGIMREYLFEVAIISINWFTLIIAGPFLSRVFAKNS